MDHRGLVTGEERIVQVHFFSSGQHLYSINRSRFLHFLGLLLFYFLLRLVIGLLNNGQFCIGRLILNIHGVVVTGFEGFEGLVQVFCNTVPAFFAAQGGKIVGVGDETYFHQNRRHGRAPEHPEGILGYSPAVFDGTVPHGLGHIFGESEAVAQMGILHEAEDDGRLRVVGVEALIGGLVIVFQQNNGVLSLDQV